VSKTALTVVNLVAKLIIRSGFWSKLLGGGAAEYSDRVLGVAGFSISMLLDFSGVPETSFALLALYSGDL
jgi:hypothetical protein